MSSNEIIGQQDMRVVQAVEEIRASTMDLNRSITNPITRFKLAIGSDKVAESTVLALTTHLSQAILDRAQFEIDQKLKNSKAEVLANFAVVNQEIQEQLTRTIGHLMNRIFVAGEELNIETHDATAKATRDYGKLLKDGKITEDTYEKSIDRIIRKSESMIGTRDAHFEQVVTDQLESVKQAMQRIEAV